MSSSDASDLVDSDEVGNSSLLARSSPSRLLVQGGSSAATRSSSPAAPQPRPEGGGGVRAQKRSRLGNFDEASPCSGCRREKGKCKAARCSNGAVVAAPCAAAGSRRGARKKKLQTEEHSSSSWHGSGSSGGGGSGSSDEDGGGRRRRLVAGRKRTRSTRGASATTSTTAKSGRRLDKTRSDSSTTPSALRNFSKQGDSDSSYTCRDAAEDGAQRKEKEREVTLEQEPSAAKARGRATQNRSNPTRPTTRLASRNTDGTDGTFTTATRRDARNRSKGKATEAAFHQLLESSSDDDDPVVLRRPPATVKSRQKPAGSVDADIQKGGGGGGRGSNYTPVALSDDDDLRDTDSDGAGVAAGSGCDGDDGSDGPVLCRCGAQDWRDGARWIRCDVRGCRTWEHVNCAYPEKAEAESNHDEKDGKGVAAKAHVCSGCHARGSSAAGARKARGGRLSLTRCGDDGSAAPSSKPSLKPVSPSVGTAATSDSQRSRDAETSRVRRSLRVSGREEMRVRLRKNVVGDEEVTSCSDDDPSVSCVGVSIGGAFGGDDGIDTDRSEANSEADFWAPEGHVEMSQEYRCRCGGTLQDGGARCDDETGKGASGEWIQCHSDACGVWEHAACCKHGCSSSSSSRTSRHYCLDCDPKGKKHARWQEKRRKQLKGKRAAQGAAVSGGVATAAAAEAAADSAKVGQRKKTKTEKRFGTLLESLWAAVFSGNAHLLEQAFREAEGSGIPVGRLLEAGQLPPQGSLDVVSLLAGGCAGGTGGTERTVMGGNVIASKSPAANLPLSAGVSLLMLAAGYWKSVADKAALAVGTPSPAATVLVETSCIATESSTVTCVENRPEKSGLAGVGSANPTPGTPRRLLPIDGTAGKLDPEEQAVEAAENEAPVRKIEREAESEATVDAPGNLAPTTGAAPALSQPPIAAEGTPTVTNAVGGGIPLLGSEERLAVLRLVLEWSDEGAMLAVDAEGRTALHHAAAAGGAGEVSILLEEELGGEVALMMSHERLTPLHIAAASGHPETCVAILRALPPGPRAAVLKASDGEASDETALHLACLDGRAACVQAILDEEGRVEKELADEMTSHVLRGVPAETPRTYSPLVLARTTEGTTALMAAAGCPSPPCVQLVIENLRHRVIPQPGSTLSELRAVDQLGMNALHYAAGRDAEGSVAAAKALLDAERSFARHLAVSERWDEAAMINGGDAKNDASPLHLAAAISHNEMVSLLLTEGANSVLEDRHGWTPVMYADFGGRKEGAVLELLQHEPERQLEALGRVLSSRNGRDGHGQDQHHHARIVEVVRNLVTVPSFFALVNGFIRDKPYLLLGSLSFLKNEPGLLDFENKRVLMRMLLRDPDENTRNTLDLFAHPPLEGFGYDYGSQICIRRGPGQALGALLAWMEGAAYRWRQDGLAAWLRVNQPSFTFDREAGYGQGVGREAWEMIAGDLVLPFPPPPQQQQATAAATTTEALAGAGDAAGNGDADKGSTANEAFFVPVDEGMSSYCPRDLRGGGGDGAGGGVRQGRRERERDLEAFELLGMLIGANLGWNKVLNLNLNPVVWKVILSRKVRQSDLELVDPMYYKSLMQMLEMEGVDQFCLQFGDLALQFCADTQGVDPEDAVTDDNKALYAKLALESKTSGRWRKQARALSHGLRRLVPLGLLKMFTENELGLLLAGPGDIDPDDWERNAKFTGEPSAMLRGWFWSVVRSLTKEERSLLLQFATGCSRLPAGGFKGLAPRTFAVAMIDYNPERPLPMAATCFYMLKLPRYPDLYSLRKYLLVAIRHGSAGFEFS